MKKALSLALTLCMVLSLFATFVVSASAESTNVALGKDYTITGCGMGYENLSGQWPSSYTANLTDGAAHEELTFGETKNWFAFYYSATADSKYISAPGGTGAAVVDLGEVVAGVNKFRVHLGNHHGNGVADPVSFSVSYSVDGTEYTKAGDFELKDSATTEGAVIAYWSEVVLDTAVSARYVKFEVTLTGVFAFLNELEVYADPSAAVVEDKVIDLLAQEGSVTVTNCSAGDLTYTLDSNGFKVNCLGTDWPNAYLKYTTPVTVDVAGAYIEIEATVTGGRGGSIRLMGVDEDAGAVYTDDIYLQQFDPDVTIDNGGDAPTGSVISYKLPISELAYCIYDADNAYAGKTPITAEEVTFIGLQVFSCGEGCVVDITKLNVVIPGSGAEVVMEEITVDGDVTDTGWAKKGWIKVSGDNGSWQYPTHKEVAEGTPIPTFTYTHQLRADETKLYGAVVLNGVHEVVDGEAKNIKVRIWFRDNDEATVYSSFYDFVLAPDGTLTTAAKYNQSTTANSGALIENTTLEAVAKVVNGKTVYEFSIALDEVTKDGNFDYFISLERKQNVNTGTLYYPFIPELAETSPHGNYPWMLWYTANDATVAVEDILLGEVPAEDENEDEADTSMMGDAPAAPKFSATLNGPEAWVAGEKVKIDVVIEVLEDELALNQILFNLFFDAADVEITLPDDDFSALVTAAPADSWKSENAMFALSTVDGYGLISGGVGSENEADSLKKGDKVVVSFEFTAKADAEGLINFQLSNDELAGYTYADPATAIAGAGSNLAIAEKTDDLGDAGIYAIAALAIVALIGTAVVIKKRA